MRSALNSSWLPPALVLALGAAIALGAPAALSGETYLLRLATQLALLVALSVAWNLVGGFTGYPSFATAAFFGLGAYATAVAQEAGWPLPLAFALAALCGALLAAPFGFAILRLRGHYFAIASLMLVTILKEVTTGWASLTGGGMGINLPGAGGDPIVIARIALQTMVMLAAAAIALSIVVARGRLGFGLACIRMNETAALGAGIDAPRLKTIAFTLSAAICGLAGAAYARWIGYIDPSDVYDVMWSVRPIIATLIGGVGTVMGPVVGAVVYMVFEELMWRNLLTFGTGALGILIALLVLIMPGGIIPSLMKRRAS
ncbi:branched-chain amino acid ABC transporter permease [Phreatobacter sp. AB_2022a]|uniref:branched-chain amino acid ABC transporter permease n=1 Tax=Phreatobacter sp. AB_2022a TaxID=3003134 RepID=UPI002286D963|nr:branched-chain amino acid ABC transporter permease [Phreatobacter sp. AB_2022a]MCZ0733486.1 branched-chain amino acid ABC transporter permease [Phreatobacter sp. AB_2022a]